MLERSPKTSQRELAQELGVSLGKVNYCLHALLDKGLVKMENFHNSQNKLAYAYLLTPEGVVEKANLTKCFLKRKIEEYNALEKEIIHLKQEIHTA